MSEAHSSTQLCDGFWCFQSGVWFCMSCKWKTSSIFFSGWTCCMWLKSLYDSNMLFQCLCQPEALPSYPRKQLSSPFCWGRSLFCLWAQKWSIHVSSAVTIHERKSSPICPTSCQKFRNNILTLHFMFWHQLMCNNPWTHFWISQLLNYFIHTSFLSLSAAETAPGTCYISPGQWCHPHAARSRVSRPRFTAATWLIMKPGVTFCWLSHTIHPAYTCASIKNRIRHF